MFANPTDLMEALRSRWRLAAGIALILFLIVAIFAFLQPRLYLATSSLMLDLSQTDPTEAAQTQVSRVDTDTVTATQIDIIRSARVTNVVAKAAGFVDQLPADLPPATRLQQAAERVRSGLAVSTGRQSNVLQIQYLDQDPQVAASVANIVAQTYMKQQVELRAEVSRDLAGWFEDRTADVRKRYERAQKTLADFQRANNIIGADRMDLEADKLKNLSYHLVQAQADDAAARSKSGSSTVSDVSTTLVVQNLEEAAALQSAKVAELAKTLGPRHPTMVAARAQLSELSAKLNAARGNGAAAMSANSAATGRREAQLRGDMSSQESRMIDMSDIQDRLMVLQRDVDAARQTYDTVRQRFNEASLKSQISQPNASLLDQAIVPLFPAQPNVKLWLVVGLIFGVMAGIATVILLELFRPRARSVAGTARATEVTVIADLSGRAGSSHHNGPRAIGWAQEAA